MCPPDVGTFMSSPVRDLALETIAPDERAVTAEFVAFLEAASARRYPTGPIRRFNQGRSSGCVEARKLKSAVRIP